MKIVLLYNNKNINLELPSTYEKFLNLLEDKLYLTPELMKKAIIYYIDSEGDKIPLTKDNYEDCFEECNGNFEMIINFNQKKNDNDNDDDNENNDEKQINKKLDKNEKKEIEKKIAKKFSKIFESKLRKKDLEHQKEISTIKKDFENAMKSVIEQNESQFKDISDYYNDKMKEIFNKYNEMIVQNINEGISNIDLNNLMEKFVNDNQFEDFNKDVDQNNDEKDMFFSRVINNNK